MNFKPAKKRTVIAEGTKVEGRIYSPYPTYIEGKVIGEIESKESITIGRWGEIIGNIKTKNVIIEGTLNGNLIAAGAVEITCTGRLIGNIISNNLNFTLKPNGVFKGSKISVENEEIFEIKPNETLGDLEITVQNT